MSFLGLVKRIAPFALTFGLGLFIASLFITLPTWSFPKRGENRWNRRHKCNAEMEWLRERNAYLERRNAEYERMTLRIEPNFENLDVPPPPMPPMPPKAPNYAR
ncbi:MAG TPA: hypothetical protein PKY59_21175 [Pyrinomonadaceae bacterium]|nr:hypothetical protein [Pyrinomonadaceae bacterium]